MSLDRLRQLHGAGLLLRAQHGEPMAKEAWMGSVAKALGKFGLGKGTKALGWMFEPGKISKRALPIGVGMLGGGSAVAGGVQAAKDVKIPKRGPAPPTYAS